MTNLLISIFLSIVHIVKPKVEFYECFEITKASTSPSRETILHKSNFVPRVSHIPALFSLAPGGQKEKRPWGRGWRYSGEVENLKFCTGILTIAPKVKIWSRS